MESIFLNYARRLNRVDIKFFRYIYNSIDWSGRLIGVVGGRGIGKTTMILQHIKICYPNITRALYITLDDLWFYKNNMSGIVEFFYRSGGRAVFIDEVDLYKGWWEEIKEIYHKYEDLRIVFISSSAPDPVKFPDINKICDIYRLNGFSFREYLAFEEKLDITPFPLHDILSRHQQIAADMNSKVKVLSEFKRYLKYGYYPFYKTANTMFSIKLAELVSVIMERNVPYWDRMEIATLDKIKKLLYIIAEDELSKPNISSLSKEIELTRGAIVNFLNNLQNNWLLRLFLDHGKEKGVLAKPDIIFLDNHNLYASLRSNELDESVLRETFFTNQLSAEHTLNCIGESKYLINGVYKIEVGGAGKDYSMIKDITNTFIATDDIEIGYWNKIPLWLFGMLY